MASEMAIGAAIDFHTVIGTKRKEARLRYLKNYWYEKAVKLKGAVATTSLKPEYSCGIANIGFEGWKANDIEAKLFEKQKIHTSSIIIEKVNGIRVTPNVYTNLYDLNLLVKGLTDISQMPAPGGK
jgi:selenocysteine lyase/cysteine desulfurase